jgi:hypothetical protein
MDKNLKTLEGILYTASGRASLAALTRMKQGKNPALVI